MMNVVDISRQKRTFIQRHPCKSYKLQTNDKERREL